MNEPIRSKGETFEMARELRCIVKLAHEPSPLYCNSLTWLVHLFTVAHYIVSLICFPCPVQLMIQTLS